MPPMKSMKAMKTHKLKGKRKMPAQRQDVEDKLAKLDRLSISESIDAKLNILRQAKIPDLEKVRLLKLKLSRYD